MTEEEDNKEDLERRLAAGARTFAILKTSVTLAMGALTIIGGLIAWLLDRSDKQAASFERRLERYEEKKDHEYRKLVERVDAWGFSTQKDIRAQYKAMPAKRPQARLEKPPTLEKPPAQEKPIPVVEPPRPPEDAGTP